MFYCCGLTDRGKVRERNEDALLIGERVISEGSCERKMEAPFFAAVADGVSGEAAGGEASLYALRRLAKMKGPPAGGAGYERMILDIHERLKKRGVKRNSPNMQTTLCALAVAKQDDARVINIGDSRLYRYRDGLFKQLSTDQSLVQALYEQGGIASEEKLRHSRKNIIFPVIGSLNANPKVDIRRIDDGFIRGDIILLCTDGLSDYVTVGDMEEAFSMPRKLFKRLSSLAEKAADNGSRDNITALAVYYY
jgi:serine/threonine protein phosphatase PrpC